MSEVKNVEVVENVEVTEVVEETKKVGFLAKTGNFIKNHKVGIGIAAGVAAVVGIGVALLKAGSKNDDLYEEDSDFDAADLEFDEETTE